MALNTAEAAAAAGVITFAVWQLHTAYTNTAPSLSDLRDADPHSGEFLHLIDADITVGMVAAIAGVSASLLTKSWVPVGIVSLAYGALVWYHHSALNGPAPYQGES